MQQYRNKYGRYLFKSIWHCGKINITKSIKNQYCHYNRREVFFYEKYKFRRLVLYKEKKWKNSCDIVCNSHHKDGQKQILMTRHLRFFFSIKTYRQAQKIWKQQAYRFLELLQILKYSRHRPKQKG